MRTAARQVTVTTRKANADVEPIDRVTNCASARTPNAASGATATRESRKNRCSTNSADGAVLRFRLLIQAKNGPAKINAIRLQQKYHRARSNAWIAQTIL